MNERKKNVLLWPGLLLVAGTLVVAQEAFLVALMVTVPALTGLGPVGFFIGQFSLQAIIGLALAYLLQWVAEQGKAPR